MIPRYHIEVERNAVQTTSKGATMELKISSYDKPSFEQLYGLFRENRAISLGDGTELTFQGIEFKKAEGFPEVAAFLVTVSAHVPAALAADLIKDWIIT